VILTDVAKSPLTHIAFKDVDFKDVAFNDVASKDKAFKDVALCFLEACQKPANM